MDRISKSKYAKQTWSTMRTLSGKESHTTGQSSLYKGRVYASERAKASPFDQEYAKISGRKNDKESRKAFMDLRCPTRSTRTSTMQQIEEAFTPGELQLVLSQLNAGKAAGPDGVSPDLRKHPSTKGSSVLLNILSSCWLSSWCPQSWRRVQLDSADCMIQFLKKWKNLADVGSYSPIALTSTIGKILERLIANRKSWWLGKHSALSPWQAGFRKGRKTTDQFMRMSLFTSDVFLSTQRRRAIATLFDFSLAFRTPD